MQAVERTVTVPTPLDRVWPYLEDFTNTEDWDPPTESTTRLGGDGGVGTTYRNVSRLLGRAVETTYTVVDHEPQRLLRLAGEATGMRTLDTITFEGGPDGTTVTYRAEFHPQGVAKVVEPLLPLGLERLGDATRDQLEDRLRRL